MAQNKYSQIIQRVFEKFHEPGMKSFVFQRENLSDAARELNITAPSNVGDILYAFRSRRQLPDAIRRQAPQGREWIIRPTGIGQYQFALVQMSKFEPSSALVAIRIPDSTPALVDLYRQSDEQALLAIIRYNRLVDIFTRLSCFSIQSHLRTILDSVGQVEIDELYVGIDRRGAHYVLPIEVKSVTDHLGIVQIENMFELSSQKFPSLIVRPLGAQFMDSDVIAMFEFVRDPTDREIRIASERHYRLVAAEQLPSDALHQYQQMTLDD